MRHPRRLINASVIATGICSVAMQLVILRECLTQFQGNEFIIALMLFGWLLAGGLGTLAAYGLSGRFLPTTPTALGGLSLVLTAMAAVQLPAMRGLRTLLFIPGAAVGFYPTLGFISATTAPYALLVGFLLPFSFFVLRRLDPAYPSTHIYIVDNMGDICGGALFSFLLVFAVTPVEALALAHLPLFFLSAGLLWRRGRSFLGLLGALALTAAIFAGGLFYETESLAPYTGRLAFYHESRYGRITVAAMEEAYILFKDGQPVFTSGNKVAAEEAVHYPLSQLSGEKAPEILLLSIEAGMVAQLAKYRPSRIDYVELDRAVSEALFRFKLLEKVKGLKVIQQDGRRWLKQTSRTYDAIIVNMPEPDTFQVNRFYTRRFFELAKQHINAGGVLSFSMQGFDNYVAEPQRRKLSAIFNTVRAHFRHVLLLPGQQVYFLCRDLPIDADIPARLAKKGIRSDYVAGFYHGNVTRERIEKLNRLLDPKIPVNTDFKPRLMRIMFDQWFARFGDSPRLFFMGLALFLALYLWRVRRETFVLFSTGFTAMGSEILVIFAFQIFYGYVYFQIGLIVTVFLAGLLPGAWAGQRYKFNPARLLRLTDAALILATGFFLWALLTLGDRLPPGFFLVYGFGVALLCGFQFPLVLHGAGEGEALVTQAFSADLVGAAAGVLVTSVALMPYAGLTGTILALMALKAVSLFLIRS